MRIIVLINDAAVIERFLKNQDMWDPPFESTAESSRWPGDTLNGW